MMRGKQYQTPILTSDRPEDVVFYGLVECHELTAPGVGTLRWVDVRFPDGPREELFEALKHLVGLRVRVTVEVLTDADD